MYSLQRSDMFIPVMADSIEVFNCGATRMLLGPGVFYSLSMFSFFAKHLIHNVLFFCGNCTS